MAKFYDDLRRNSGAVEPELREKLGGALIIDATNLSDYLYANEAKGEWDLVKDFFNLAPPFDKFFVECRAPQQMLTKEGLVPWPSHLPKRWGVLFLATDITKLDEHGRAKVMGFGEGVPLNIKWVVQAILFAETPYTYNGKFNGQLREQFTWWFPILPDGSQPVSQPRQRMIQVEYTYHRDNPLMPEPDYIETAPGKGTITMTEDLFNLMHIKNLDSGCRFWYPSGEKQVISKELTKEIWDNFMEQTSTCHIKVMSLREDVPTMRPGYQIHYTALEEQYWLSLLQPCLMSICFLHVKNVTLERQEPPPALVKKAIKRYGEPPCTFHVLQVQPFKRVLDSEGHVSQTGIRHALGICRGHFHFYGDEFGKGKLFGKYSGSFWIPSHLRGSIEYGLKDKSYSIDPKKKQADA